MRTLPLFFLPVQLLCLFMLTGCETTEEVLTSKPVICSGGDAVECDCGAPLPTGVKICDDDGFAFGECDCNADLTTINPPAAFIAGTHRITEMWQVSCPPKTYVKSEDVQTGLKRCAVCPLNTISDTENASACRPKRFTDVAAGQEKSCGVYEDGSLQCWGSGLELLLAPARYGFSEIVSAGYSACGLRLDGAVTCLGPFEEWTNISLSPGEFTDFSLGGDISLNIYPVSGNASCGISTDGRLECNEGFEHLNIPNNGLFAKVSVGNGVCGLHTDGRVECFGEIAGDDPVGVVFREIAAGWGAVCGIADSGHVQCWRDDICENVRNFESTYDWSPACQTLTTDDGVFTQLDAGPLNFCGIREDGTAKCWGLEHSASRVEEPASDTDSEPDSDSEMDTASEDVAVDSDAIICPYEETPGYGGTVSEAVRYGYFIPAASPAADEQFTAIDAGFSHSCGVKKDGTISCWGTSDGMALMSFPMNARSECGRQNYGDLSCVTYDDGSVDCWRGKDMNAVHAAPPDETFIQVAETVDLGCGIREDGTVFCWGDICVVDVGCDGTCDPTPLSPPEGVTFTSLMASFEDFVCGLTVAGTVECWGTREISSPDGMTFIQFTASRSGVCGLTNGGDVVCWDFNGVVERPLSAHNSYSRISDIGGFNAWGFKDVGWGLCAISTEGVVECEWTGHDAYIVPTPDSPMRDIKVLGSEICGVGQNGLISCWGLVDIGRQELLETTNVGRTKFLRFTEGCHSDVCAIREYDGVKVCWDPRGLRNVWQMP